MSSVPEQQQQSTVGMTPVQQADYLEQDPDLRGQRYVCLSFLSPEDVLVSREAFTFNRFISTFASEMNDMLNGLNSYFKDQPNVQQSIQLVRERYRYMFSDTELDREYEFYKQQNGTELERQFQERNGYRTSVRGIKVRGVYDSIPEAKARVDAIRKFDTKFNVYIAEVGCWCPWSPNPDDLANQEYAETALNTLAKSYAENASNRDQEYAERKRDLTAAMQHQLETDAWPNSKKPSATSEEDSE